jgi:hypothetical protein
MEFATEYSFLKGFFAKWRKVVTKKKKEISGDPVTQGLR